MLMFDSYHFAAKMFKENLDIATFYVRGRKGGLNEISMKNKQSNNGIHISLQMRCLISTELVKGVGFLTRANGARYRECMWKQNVSARSS